MDLEARLEDAAVSQRRKLERAMKLLMLGWEGRANVGSQEHWLEAMQNYLVDAHDAVSGLRLVLKLRTPKLG